MQHFYDHAQHEGEDGLTSTGSSISYDSLGQKGGSEPTAPRFQSRPLNVPVYQR